MYTKFNDRMSVLFVVNSMIVVSIACIEFCDGTIVCIGFSNRINYCLYRTF